jgi:CheY-like chemotaxis protein
MKGLIVECSPALSLLLGNALRALAFEPAAVARDFSQALRRLSGVDFMISDGNASHYRALLLARRHRNAPETNLIPLVMITAHRSSVELLEAITAGVDCCLVKPFTDIMLQEKIQGAIAARPRISA